MRWERAGFLPCGFIYGADRRRGEQRPVDRRLAMAACRGTAPALIAVDAGQGCNTAATAMTAARCSSWC
jgi:hypothetical protein